MKPRSRPKATSPSAVGRRDSTTGSGRGPSPPAARPARSPRARRELERARSWLARASNQEILRLGALLFPGRSPRGAYVRAAALRLYALRLSPGEWQAFLLDQSPAAIVVDAHDLALLAEIQALQAERSG